MINLPKMDTGILFSVPLKSWQTSAYKNLFLWKPSKFENIKTENKYLN